MLHSMIRFFPLLLAAAWLSLISSVAAKPREAAGDESWVKARVQEIMITPEDRRLDEIGWAKDIREAKRLARETGRPVFLFTHDGRLNIGRC